MNSILTAQVNGALLGAFIATVLWLTLRLAPRRVLNAATRYMVWWATLVIVITLPILYAPAHSLLLRQKTFAPALAKAQGNSRQELAQPQGVAAFGSESSPSLTRIQQPIPPTSTVGPHRREPIFPVRIVVGQWTSWIVAVWVLSTTFLLVRLLISCRILEHRKRRAFAAPPTLAARLQEWLIRCRSRRTHVRVAISTEVEAPMVAGPYQPTILIPAQLCDSLDLRELDQIGLHETAHLARCDDYALWLQRLVEAVFAWHPAVRWISRQIDLEREIACDDFVVEAMGNSRPYAACLAHVIELSGGVRASLVAACATEQASHLARRVEVLLDKARHRGTRLLPIRLAVLGAGLIILAVVAFRSPEPLVLAAVRPSSILSVSQWIRANAIPLPIAQTANDTTDMRPLEKIVGDASIVALGEATHGPRQFFQLRQHMLEFLVKDMGFHILALEMDMAAAAQINQYVLTGHGDPEELVNQKNVWPWDTQELLNLIGWMREVNQSGRGHVELAGFDMNDPTSAQQALRQFVARNDVGYLPTLKRSSRQATAAHAKARPADFGVAGAVFPVSVAAGKHIRFSGYIKTDNISRGWAGLWWRVDSGADVLAFDNMQDRGVTGTQDWKRFVIDLPVAEDATNINFGVLQSGDGTAWFDGLAIEVDGKPYRDSNAIDLDFESSRPTGFYTGGNGYEVQPDRAIFHSGKQSLRMRYLGAPEKPQDSADSRAASLLWKEVVQHLDQSRSAYRMKGISDRDVEWAIQNARTVLQCVQIDADEVSRNASMADNIEWLAHNEADAKIVIWTHNELLASAGYGGNDLIADLLRKKFGSQMVAFGLATGEDPSSRVEQGKELRDVNLSPPDGRGLDATLAAIRIRQFALDLRNAPESGPVAAWLSEPHPTTVALPGAAGTCECTTRPAPKSFDVLVFADKTRVNQAPEHRALLAADKF